MSTHRRHIFWRKLVSGVRNEQAGLTDGTITHHHTLDRLHYISQAEKKMQNSNHHQTLIQNKRCTRQQDNRHSKTQTSRTRPAKKKQALKDSHFDLFWRYCTTKSGDRHEAVHAARPLLTAWMYSETKAQLTVSKEERSKIRFAD